MITKFEKLYEKMDLSDIKINIENENKELIDKIKNELSIITYRRKNSPKPIRLIEISGYFIKIEDITIKPKNRKFTKEEYYNFLFLEPYCNSKSDWNNFQINSKYIKMIIVRINSQYHSNIKEEDLDWDKISTLFKIISERISNYESVDDIINLIKVL